MVALSTNPLELAYQSAALIQVSISTHFHNKVNTAPLRADGSNDYAFAFKWKQAFFTQRELINWINSGRAYTVAAYSSDHRDSDNFANARLIGLDFDHTAYETLLLDPFVNQFAFFAGATDSHTPDAPRCRVLFCLDDVIGDAAHYERMIKRVWWRLRQYDPDASCVDIARFFFGASQKPHYAALEDTYLPLSVLDSLEDMPAYTPLRTSEGAPVRYVATDVDSLCAAIEATLGVTGYQSNGWSHAVRCPLATHEHDDTAPAAHWHAEKKIFRCFKCDGTLERWRGYRYMSGVLGIRRQYTPAIGLHNSTRERLVQTDQDTAARLLDLLFMVGHTSGQRFTADYLIQLAEQVKAAGRKVVMSGLKSGLFVGSPDMGQKARPMLDVRAPSGAQCGDSLSEIELSPVFSAFPVVSFISKGSGKSGTKLKSAGRKPVIYTVPSEEMIAAQIGAPIPTGRLHAPLSYADLKSAAAYRKAMLLDRIVRAKGDPIAQKHLAANIGATSRTVRNYIKATGIGVIPTHRVAALITPENVDDFNFAAYYGMAAVWLAVDDKDRFEPRPDRARELLRFYPSVELRIRAANIYTPPVTSAPAQSDQDTPNTAESAQIDTPPIASTSAPAPKPAADKADIMPILNTAAHDLQSVITVEKAKRHGK